MMQGDVPERIRAEASDWFARLTGDRLDRRGKRDFQAWLAADPRHRPALEALAAVWRDANVAAHAFAHVGLASPARRAQRRRAALAACAALLVIACGSVAVWKATDYDRYETARGEARDITLVDGSLLHLGAATRVDVRLRDGERRLWLDHGEALFEVAPDKARPFRVHAGDRIVEAVGTRFDINRIGDQVVVAVGEGTVRVAAPATDERDQGALLGQGQSVAYGKAGDLGAIQPVSAERVGAWRNGQLLYDRAPVWRVLADLNRHLARRLVIDDRTLGATSVSGAFQIRDEAATIAALERMLNVRAASRGNEIVLTPARGGR